MTIASNFFHFVWPLKLNNEILAKSSEKSKNLVSMSYAWSVPTFFDLGFGHSWGPSEAAVRICTSSLLCLASFLGDPKD